MLNQFKSFQHQQGKISQRLLIIVAIVVTALIATALLFSSKKAHQKKKGMVRKDMRMVKKVQQNQLREVQMKVGIVKRRKKKPLA